MITALTTALGITLGGTIGWMEAAPAVYRGVRLLHSLDKHQKHQLEAMTPEQRKRAETALSNHETFRGGII
jgi:hypothetical protein